MGLNHGALGETIGVGLEVFDLGHQQDHLEQLVDVLASEGAHRHHHGAAAPVFGHQILAGELLLHPLRRGSLLVDLVDRHHDRYLGGAGVADRLQGLGPHAVIGGHHQHGHVGDLGAAGPHGGEGLVARGVEEGDLAQFPGVGHFHLIGADVLGDAAGLARRHAGLADGIEQAGLAVVHVAHHRHHGGAADQVGEVTGLDHLHGLGRCRLDVVLKHRHAELFGHCLDRGQIERLGDGGADALEEEGFDDLGALHPEPVGQLLHREVALRHDQHLGPLGLELASRPQLHGAAALTLAGGFLLPFPYRHRGLGGSGGSGAGLGWPGQAGLENDGLLFAGETTGFCGERIIVLADDVDLLALLLGRAAAQGLQLGAVVPVGTPGPAGGSPGGLGRPEARAPGRCGRRGGGTDQIGRAGRAVGPGLAPVGTAGGRSRGTHARLLELHQLAGGHWLAHAGGHAGTARGGGAHPTRTTGIGTVATDRFAHQLARGGTGTARAGGEAGGSAWGGPSSGLSRSGRGRGARTLGAGNRGRRTAAANSDRPT